MDKIRAILADWSEGTPVREFREAEQQYDELLAHVDRLRTELEYQLVLDSPDEMTRARLEALLEAEPAVLHDAVSVDQETK